VSTENKNLTVLPTKGDRQKVDDTLKAVAEQQCDEVVVLAFKDGKSYLHHSKIENMSTLIGAIEWLKYRLMEKG
jgi:hypothetical protein